MMRLQKFLSTAGVASRRKSEELILAGKVKVNGEVVKELGTKVSDKDKIEYDNKIITTESSKIYIALNKPVGYISSASSSQGKSVLDLVKLGERIYPVGRLDKDSSGLIILTNDGEFTNHITHPKYESEKEYEVVINRPITDLDIKKLKLPMVIDGKKLQPVQVVKANGVKVTLVLKEGINRQIRKMMSKLGYRVVELQRVRIGKLKIGNLKSGEFKTINPKSI